MDDETKKDESGEDTATNEAPTETKTCRECGSSMTKHDDKWVCDKCKHEMPA